MYGVHYWIHQNITSHWQACHSVDHVAFASWCHSLLPHRQGKWLEAATKTHVKVNIYLCLNLLALNHRETSGSCFLQGQLHLILLERLYFDYYLTATNFWVYLIIFVFRRACIHLFGEGIFYWDLNSWPLTMSVPKSIHRMVTTPRGRGMPKTMNIKNGVISGMLLVKV
jgi:hypothetical protein